MYTPLQLNIIREFGNKELTEGCIIYINEDADYCRITYMNDFFYTTDYEGEKELIGNFDASETDKYKILGHIPHLEDVFRVAKEKRMFYGIEGEYEKENEFKYIEYIWFSNIDIGENKIPYIPNLPLLDQDESTLTQLLTLFTTGETNT